MPGPRPRAPGIGLEARLGPAVSAVSADRDSMAGVSTDETNGSAFGRGVNKAPPTAAAELRRRMAASPAGFLRSAAWVPWKAAGTPEAGSVAHVMIRDKPFVPVFTDPGELAAGLPEAEGRPVPMSELVFALPDQFGISLYKRVGAMAV